MKFTIRKAKPVEAPVIMDYLQRHFIFAGIQDRSTITMKEVHEAFFEKEEAFAILALEDETPVGLATYYYNFSTLTGKQGIFIEDLFIDEDARGKGYGKQLIQTIFNTAKAQGIEKVDWYVLKDNHRAIELYKNLDAQLEDELLVFTKEL